MKRALILFGLVLSLCVNASINLNAQAYRYDATEMDNTIKFNVVKWNVNYSCSYLDRWFSEKPGLVTDSMSWLSGNNEDWGYFTFHRFNQESYTCNYVRTRETKGNDGYGANTNISKRDAPYSSLKRGGDYYVLDLRDFKGYVPLYLPFSKEHNKRAWERGALVFEWIGDGGAAAYTNNDNKPVSDVVSSYNTSPQSSTGDDISIKIDDPTFKKRCLMDYDTNKDGKLSQEEAEAVTKIEIMFCGLQSLKGLEYFTNLKKLDCSLNNLTRLDVSKNRALEELRCDNNKLTSLDVSKNTSLQQLFCKNNKLTSLVINPELRVLYCDNNQLTNLDVSRNTELYMFHYDGNRFATPPTLPSPESKASSSTQSTKEKVTNNEVSIRTAQSHTQKTISASTLQRTVWECTEYGLTYKDKNVTRYQFLGDNKVRVYGSTFLDGRVISNAEVYWSYS